MRYFESDLGVKQLSRLDLIFLPFKEFLSQATLLKQILCVTKVNKK
jgi:hypothetical protein